ncbi:PREDICTED: telomere repeat-binding protein 3-like isoform X2 [Populus euphratica]|uniref:Telomere repeat-binding protein 3-like isoform X2 n=1 Tax=Populus euphratica TaxID=75702 RepID=A0AAJ6XQ66_POPEU|nr:PREDICTED: telomere repeat-binding protein 3-like isoform X2 [Populus euphratica]
MGLNKTKVEDSQICAFELLASLAGKLLQESESSASSNASEANDQPVIGGGGGVKFEQDDDRPLRAECLDHGSCGESAFFTRFSSPNNDQKCLLNEFPHAESNLFLERSSMIMNSNSSKNGGADLKSVICKSIPGKVEGSSDSRVSCDGYVDNGLSRQKRCDRLDTRGLIGDPCSSNDPMEKCMKFPVLINSVNNVELPSCRDPVTSASIPRHRNGIKLGIRDDAENFTRCNKPLTKSKAFRPPQRIGDRRIRKLLTSKHWKVGPKLKDCEFSKPAFLEGGVKSHYLKRKLCYSRERNQRNTFYKRRKFTDHSVVVTSDGGFSSESVCNSPDKNMTGDKNGASIMFHDAANGVSSSVIGHQASFHSKDSQVKFSIKSFRVPELLIEVPETATVGSLKRTVVEAVSAILGGGLRVGVLLHGKKVRDDNRTLLQTGITSNENLDALGFSLEPNPLQVSPPSCTEDPPALLPCDTSQLILRSPTSPIVDSGISDALPDLPPLTNLDTNIESNRESASSHADIVTDNTLSDSRALVAVPPVNTEELAMVPLNQKSKRSELVQRRTRRPFSVSEVEALVHAVEELGTGRWRDVNLRSFEDADHRTYVDLKDKWKTLVHTARIAPQQRRGEPVPQELLDRVLAAHAYWSQHQAKQHSKNQTAILKITDAHAVRNGVEDIQSI